jgi:hypothetical protein
LQWWMIWMEMRCRIDGWIQQSTDGYILATFRHWLMPAFPTAWCKHDAQQFPNLQLLQLRCRAIFKTTCRHDCHYQQYGESHSRCPLC